MKFRLSILGMAFLMLACIGTVQGAVTSTKPNKEAIAKMSEAEKTARLEEIQLRVKEIKAMDKSDLSRTERKALKKELRAMNKESKAVSGGVYLSVGAIIIIILLLILIL